MIALYVVIGRLKMDDYKKRFAIQALRRASYRWPGRGKAAKRSHKGRNEWECETCKGLFPQKETVMDHVIPVVDPAKGFSGFDEYIDRMFCDESNFSRKCKACHAIKTEEENKVRRENRTKDEPGFKKKLDKSSKK